MTLQFYREPLNEILCSLCFVTFGIFVTSCSHIEAYPSQCASSEDKKENIFFFCINLSDGGRTFKDENSDLVPISYFSGPNSIFCS